MNKKLEYLTPEVDVFTVQTEGVICQSGEFDINGFQDDLDILDFTTIL